MRTITIEKKLHFREKKINLIELEDYFVNLKNTDIVLATCPCRSLTERSGSRACCDKHPVGACVFTGAAARHLQSRGIGTKIIRTKIIPYLRYMLSTGLEAQCDTELSENSVICLCCGCCCSHQRHSLLGNTLVIPERLLITQIVESCNACAICADNCVAGAIEIDANQKKILINADRCVSCGVCVDLCPESAIAIVGKTHNKNE